MQHVVQLREPRLSANTFLFRFRRDHLLQALLLLALVLTALDPRPPREYLGWLDLPTLAGLCGLLILTEGVRASGHVQRFALHVVARLRNVRALAFALVLLAAALATVLTNDVALFLIVPLTLAIDRIARIPRQRLVIFEALAVNAGSTFSPIGNPQNLLLWQHSGLGFFGYVAALAPAGAVLLIVLLVACGFTFSAAPLHLHQETATAPRLDTPLLAGSLASLAAMVAAMQWGFAVPAALIVMAIGVAFFRRVLASVDWLLLATFAAMFVGLGHLAALPFVHAHVGALAWHDPRVTYAGGIVLSQFISNVPAAVALQHYAPNLTLLAAAVNVGGSGLMIGSLANLIALRLDGSRGIGWRFHAWSVPYLIVTAVLVALVILR
ncbi:MAG: Inner membrane protein YbiR, putative anion permease [Rhodanobacteraceae bacterium]|jgi:Na+/H+ antiporter NhaD/arsenite permease-like protein|nr:MAG: Inner membrane protein YbiR, putative anion permease [Rhodanobacteraceae bacterium]